MGRDTTLSWQYRDINGRQQHASQTIRFTKLFPQNDKQLMAQDSEFSDQEMRKTIMITRFVMFVHQTLHCRWWNKSDLRRFEAYWEHECRLLPADGNGQGLGQDITLLRKFVDQDAQPEWCPLM